MQHDLVHQLWRVDAVSLAPIVAYGISKDGSVAVEVRRTDCAANSRISLKTVFGILVPEMEGAVTSCGAEGTMLWVERDGVYGENVGGLASRWCLAVALEGEVEAESEVLVRPEVGF